MSISDVSPTSSSSSSLSPEENTAKMIHTDEHIASSIMLNMNLRRLAGDYCDVTLVVADNVAQEIHAHKLVLSSYSRYFEGLFNPSMKEGKQDRVVIHDLHGPTVNQLVEFAYTGKIEITAENIENLLKAADFLAIESVCRACCDFMKKNMNLNNVIGVLLCAELYVMSDLKEAAFDIAVKHFYHVVKNGEFCDLPTSFFIELISSEKLSVVINNKLQKPSAQEKFVLDAVVQYLVKNGLEASPSESVQVFENVRIRVLALRDVQDLLRSDLISRNKALKDLVMQRRDTQMRNVTDGSAPAWTRPRTYPGLRQMESGKFGESFHFRRKETFTDEEQGANSHVKGIKIFLRRWDRRISVGGLEVLYASGQRTQHGEPMRGQETPEISLNDNERIVNVRLWSGWLVDKIGFVTNERDCGDIGGPGGSQRGISAPSREQNGHLKYIKGCVGVDQGGTVLCELAFVWGYYEYD